MYRLPSQFQKSPSVRAAAAGGCTSCCCCCVVTVIGNSILNAIHFANLGKEQTKVIFAEEPTAPSYNRFAFGLLGFFALPLSLLIAFLFGQGDPMVGIVLGCLSFPTFFALAYRHAGKSYLMGIGMALLWVVGLLLMGHLEMNIWTGRF